MRQVALHYTVVVDVEDDELPADYEPVEGAPVEFYKLPDPVGDALTALGEDYFKSVKHVEPESIEWLESEEDPHG